MKLIGLFVSIGLISMFLMFAYFLKSKFSDDESTVVMYFDESVKGLDVGAPVLFKGVKIGEVSGVRLQANLHTLQFLIPVYAKIYNGRSLITDTHDEKERLDKFIRDGLRAQLAINSVITGQLLIELDMFPNSKAVLHEQAKNELEIPTIGSPFSEISKSLQVMPITQIASDVHNITQTLNKELPPLLKRMNSTMDTFDHILKENKNNTAKMVSELGNAAQNVGGAAQSFDLMVGENAAGIAAMIESFSAAAASLKNLTDYLQMYPNAVITGKEY